MISNDSIALNQNRHIRVLGVCWVIYGVLRLCAAVWLASFSNTATVMFGALLARVPDPFTMMSTFHLFYVLVVAFSLVCGVLGLLAGLALLAGRESGRTLALVAGFLSLSEIPLGTTLGIYSLIILLPMRAGHASAVVLHDQASELSGHPSAT
jgi:hypothetical protein